MPKEVCHCYGGVKLMVSKAVRCTLRIMKSPFNGNVGGTADYIRPLLLARDFLMHEYLMSRIVYAGQKRNNDYGKGRTGT